MITRRDLLKIGALGLLGSAGCRSRPPPRKESGVVLNDVHSKPNRTRVASVARPSSLDELTAAIGDGSNRELPVSIAGGRHAMGGQQFGVGTVNIDMLGLDRVLDLDADSGIIEVEAGAQWPGLIADSLELQEGSGEQWGIAQKQTGA
ncbi:MAG: FAD-dependent oxidoreductase, partial [bacterium]|nr:FAD-dependent oxidoreductase [bacterium]